MPDHIRNIIYRRVVPAAVIVLIGLLFFTYWHIRSRGSADTNAIKSDSSPADGVFIKTALPVRHTFISRIPWIGTVKALSSVDLIALVAGRVEAVYAGDQSQIEKGQPVIRLGGPQIEDAHAKLQAEIKSLERQLDLTRQTVKRYKETLSNRISTNDQLAAAQEAEVRLETQLNNARLNLKTLENRTNITSPIKGMFTNRQINQGQDVSAGQIIGEIINTGRMRVEASLFPPSGIEILGKGATIRLNENRTLSGIVRSVLPNASGTGATSVWIEGPEIDKQLHPGQMVEGDIVTGVAPDALAVPESAVVYDSQEHPYLFVSKGGSYEPVSIRTGLKQDGWIEIISGLKQDQPVVTRGAYELYYRNFNEQFKVQD